MRSHRQTLPSSQTHIKMLPSRENAVWRIVLTHCECWRVLQRDLAGSSRFSSHKKVFPYWFPSAMNLWRKSNENRMNQNSQALYSKRCTIDMDVSSLDLVVAESSSLPGFQQTIEFSHDWNIKEQSMLWSIKKILVFTLDNIKSPIHFTQST